MLVFHVPVYLCFGFFSIKHNFSLHHRATLKVLSHSSRNALCRTDLVVLAETIIKTDALHILNDVELGVPLADSPFGQLRNTILFHSTISSQGSLSFSHLII